MNLRLVLGTPDVQSASRCRAPSPREQDWVPGARQTRGVLTSTAAAACGAPRRGRVPVASILLQEL